MEIEFVLEAHRLEIHSLQAQVGMLADLSDAALFRGDTEAAQNFEEAIERLIVSINASAARIKRAKEAFLKEME